VAAFDFDRRVSVSGDPDAAWRLITDVPRLVGWISVLSDAREVAPLSSYTAVISDKVGMFKLRADLAITVKEVDHGRRIVVQAEGQDRQVGSRIAILADVSLEPAEAGTDVRVQGNYAITGNAATLGSSTIRRKGEKVLDQFFENLAAEAPAR
jgi:carbon monoxide dehydrogenase subunit G